MKYFSIIFVFVLLTTFSNLLAQDTTQLPLKKAKFALQVQMSGLLNLRPFQGNVLSGKYHISDLSAVRLGFSISNSNRFYNVEVDEELGKGQSFSFELNAQYIQYIKTEDDIAVFLGCGPSYNKELFSSYSTSSRQNAWSLGIGGVLGVEWFFKRNMSLEVEYGLKLYYTENRSSDYKDGRGNIHKSIGTSSEDMFKVGLSVYI